MSDHTIDPYMSQRLCAALMIEYTDLLLTQDWDTPSAFTDIDRIREQLITAHRFHMTKPAVFEPVNEVPC